MKDLIFSLMRWVKSCLSPYTVMQWYLISFLVLVSLTVIWYAVAYRLVLAKIACYRNEIVAKDLTVRNYLDMTATCSQARHVILALKHDLESIKNNEIDGNKVLIAIMHEAGSHGLDIDSCLSSDVVDYDWYTATTISSAVRGSLPSIGQWLAAVTQWCTMCSVQRLQLAFEQGDLFRCSCVFHVTHVKKSPSTLGS